MAGRLGSDVTPHSLRYCCGVVGGEDLDRVGDCVCRVLEAAQWLGGVHVRLAVYLRLGGPLSGWGRGALLGSLPSDCWALAPQRWPRLRFGSVALWSDALFLEVVQATTYQVLKSSFSFRV